MIEGALRVKVVVKGKVGYRYRRSLSKEYQSVVQMGSSAALCAALCAAPHAGSTLLFTCQALVSLQPASLSNPGLQPLVPEPQSPCIGVTILGMYFYFFPLYLTVASTLQREGKKK